MTKLQQDKACSLLNPEIDLHTKHSTFWAKIGINEVHY